MMRQVAVLAMVMAPLMVWGQTGAGNVDDTLRDALRSSTLTYEGKPFHAVLEIAPGTSDRLEPAGAAYSGQVEVWWASATRYRIAASSPDFTLDKTVDGTKVAESHTGTFYPQWLETFVRVFIDPVPTNLFTASSGVTLTGGPQSRTAEGFVLQQCINRDDRTNGITDQLTWGRVCFVTGEPWVDFVQTFNYFVSMKNFQPFGGKQIARDYETSVRSYSPVAGHLSLLEPLNQADEAKITVAAAGAAQDVLETKFVSTVEEESMVEKAPKIVWPPVREGKTDGYMIVYARTDVTGQVRETAKHNSDNPGLEHFGMEQALGYKFKPLLVDGHPVQMEMPLVLHFTSQISNPIPILTVEEMKPQIVSCKPELVPAGLLEKGARPVVRVSVDEKGKTVGVQPIGNAPWGKMIRAWSSLDQCKFKPYLVDGKATYYKGDVELRVP